MSPEEELKVFLTAITPNAVVTNFMYKSNEVFSVFLRSDLDYNRTHEYYCQQIRDWVEKFSEFTHTNWAVRGVATDIPPSCAKYRKTFNCEYVDNDQNQRNGNRPKKLVCASKIVFHGVSLKRLAMTISKEWPNEKRNLSILISFCHSHAVGPAMKYRIWASICKTEAMFMRYFAAGCTAAAATTFNRFMLACRFGINSSEFQSAEINPSLKHVEKLKRKQIVSKKFYKINIEGVISDMQSEMKDAGGYLDFVESCTTAVIITPLMKRIIERDPLESVLIDRLCIQPGRIVNILYVTNNSNPLPIVFIVQNQQDEHAFGLSIDSIKNFIFKECQKQFEPKILKVNASEDHFRNMTAVFLNCKMIKSYTAMCKQVWFGLCYEENKLLYSRRNEVMAAVQLLLAASNSKDAQTIYTNLMGNEEYLKGPRVKSIIDEVWESRGEWLDSSTGHSHNLTDLYLRMAAQLLLTKCRRLNLYLMVEFITKVIDNQWRIIVHALSINRNVIPIHTRYLARSDDIVTMKPSVSRIGDGYRYAAAANKVINVNPITWRCNCLLGKKNEFCEHLTAILILNSDIGQNDLSENDRMFFNGILGETTDELKVDSILGLEVNVDCEDLSKEEIVYEATEYENELFEDTCAEETTGDDKTDSESVSAQVTNNDVVPETISNQSQSPVEKQPVEGDMSCGRPMLSSGLLVADDDDDDDEGDKIQTNMTTEAINVVSNKELKDRSTILKPEENSESVKQETYKNINGHEETAVSKGSNVDENCNEHVIPDKITGKGDDDETNGHLEVPKLNTSANIPVTAADKSQVPEDPANKTVKVSVTAADITMNSPCQKLSNNGLYDRVKLKNPILTNGEIKTSSNTKQTHHNDDDDFYFIRPKRKGLEASLNINNKSHQVSAKKMRHSDISEAQETNIVQSSDSKYDIALEALNYQFQRLYGFLKENPNVSNVATIMRLTRELAKIKPVERVDLSNMYLKSNG